jgi:hypothetical protein
MTDFVDIIVEQLVNQIHMREEHSPAAVASEPKSVQNLAHILFLFHLLGPFTHELTKLLPFMGNHFTTTKTTHWDYHFALGVGEKRVKSVK